MVVSNCLAEDLWGLLWLVGECRWGALVHVAMASTHFLLRGRRTTASYTTHGRRSASSVLCRCSSGKLGEPLSSTSYEACLFDLRCLARGGQCGNVLANGQSSGWVASSTRIRPSVPPTAMHNSCGAGETRPWPSGSRGIAIDWVTQRSGLCADRSPLASAFGQW